MNNAFERRALLLHLGDVLAALRELPGHGSARTPVGELVAQHELLAQCTLLQHVAPRMTRAEFDARAVRAFAGWPRMLLEAELDQPGLAASVEQQLFVGNEAGWQAYAASLRQEVPWFGAAPASALQRPSAGASPADGSTDNERVEREESEASAHSAGSGAPLYPSWPWKPRA